MESESTNPPARRLTFARRVFRFIGRFGILLIIFSVGFYYLGRSSVFNEHPGLASQVQANAILSKVAALIQLPTGETPTIATIDDAASAKSVQPFLQNAQNGDVLIIYPNAKTALLYRPSTDKLIAVGPVGMEPVSQGVGQPQNAPEPAAASTTIKNANTNATTKK